MSTYISRLLGVFNPDLMIKRKGGGEKRAHTVTQKKRTRGLWKEEKEEKERALRVLSLVCIRSHDGGTLTQEFKRLISIYLEYKRNGWDTYSSGDHMASRDLPASCFSRKDERRR